MKFNKGTQKGFTLVEGLLVITILILLAFSGYYVWHAQRLKTTSTSMTSNGAKETTYTQSPSPSLTTYSNSPYSGWKSYTLPVEKLSFMYPPTWTESNTNSTSTQDNIIFTASDGYLFSINDGTDNGGDYVPEAPSSSAIPVTYIGQSDYLVLTYGQGSRGQGTSDGLVAGVQLQTSTNEQGGPNNGYPWATDKYAAGANTTTGADTNKFIIMGGLLKSQISLQQVPSNTDIQNTKLVIESMRY